LQTREISSKAIVRLIAVNQNFKKLLHVNVTNDLKVQGGLEDGESSGRSPGSRNDKNLAEV
jgi:hypothetical protein